MEHRFTRRKGQIVRSITIGRSKYLSFLEDRADADHDPGSAWWQSLLRGAVPTGGEARPLHVVDAFCGPGGLGLGVGLAAQAVGRKAVFDVIIDTDAEAAMVHKYNLGCDVLVTEGASSLVDFHVSGAGNGAQFAYPPEVLDARLKRGAPVDLFIAGPPCEGHSNLNNYTRRADPRNKLYTTAVALGVALKSQAILIENVPTVQNDRSGVVNEAVRLLQASGYSVVTGVLKADELGAPQSRQRFFMVAWLGASGVGHNPLFEAATALSAPATPASWAIADLLDNAPATIFDTPATLSAENRRRIDYLFLNDLHDLPDAERPDCHKNGTSYRAVYGRMHWDRPAQTITTGFNTPGQGRNVHPLRRRVITPHEAARLQGFPDWFNFDPPGLEAKRKHLAKWIGDAVHPVLGYAAGIAALAASLVAAEAKDDAADAA